MSAEIMDTSGIFHETVVRPSSTVANSLKGFAPAGFSAHSAGLMRYHSAPSSTFATLLESDFYSANDSAELVQLLANNGLHDAASFGDGGLPLKSHHKQPSSINNGQSHQVYSGQTDVVLRHSGRGAVVFEDRVGQGPLSAILEHAGEETCVPQPCQEKSIASNSNSAAADRDNQYKSNLIRQSSLPTDFLSRLALSGLSENPAASQQVGSLMQSSSQQVTSHLQSTSPRTTDNTGGKVYVVTSRMSPKGVPVRKGLTDEGGLCTEGEFRALESGVNNECSLSRQNSSPAGLLSQLTLDEFANPTEKAVKPSQTFVLGGWDEASMDFAMQKIAAMGQRKRGREIDARLTKILPATDLMMDQITTSPRNHYSVLGASNGDVTDAVLCKSRAKRGCATHPRSIAERVRRTKITERIKKLQDLVPNLDKQAHTADMLDEVVEYVKLLQQRVEELSNQSHVCNGTCQNKRNNPVET